MIGIESNVSNDKEYLIKNYLIYILSNEKWIQCIKCIKILTLREIIE